MMPWQNYFKIAVFFIGFSFWGCATTYTAEDPGPVTAEQSSGKPAQAYTGPKTTIAVLPLGLSERAAKRYPHLLDKAVGMGIHNMVIEALYDSNRFTFVEEKPEVVKDVMDRQWMSSAGMVDQSTAVRLGKILGARKVVYGEVYDYAEGGETVTGLSVRKNFRIRTGVQIRYVDVETLEYIPATGVDYGNDVPESAGRAVNTAVSVLLKRLK
jgi:curli biogenesis system outer membrane secretion channel CsgG